jgi:hypothetical protein
LEHLVVVEEVELLDLPGEVGHLVGVEVEVLLFVFEEVEEEVVNQIALLPQMTMLMLQLAKVLEL